MPPVQSDDLCCHVTASVFRRHMAALAERGFTTVFHNDLAHWIYDGREPGGKVAAIGFDDNRLNVLANALPVAGGVRLQSDRVGHLTPG